MVNRFDPTRITAGGGGPLVAYYAIAAIPARYALERGAWSDAASLPLRASPFPYADAITWFARAVGAARAGRVTPARAALDALSPLGAKLATAGEPYWADQVEIQRLSAAAWLAYAEGRHDEALDGLAKAATREDATEKAAVTPGPIAPAHEMLGEMLLLVSRPADALREFEATLAKEPNRFRSLAGAMEAARASGNTAAAAKYASELLRVAGKADVPGRPVLGTARTIARRL
jgi:hypothetical protein